MKPIELDTEHFDYNNISDRLIAVPEYVLRDYFKLKSDVEKRLQNRKVSSEWTLTEKDILEGGRQALEDIKHNRTVDARELIKKYV